MSGFLLLFERWELAEGAAVAAERRLSRQLDGYCEGWGAAPTAHEIRMVQRLRSEAAALLRGLQSELAGAREAAPVL